MFNSQFSNISLTQYDSLFHIDFPLFFLGSVNRNGLETRFGIKASTAKVFLLCKRIAPKNMECDNKSKTSNQWHAFLHLLSFSTYQTLVALLYAYRNDFISSSHLFLVAESPTQLHLPPCDILAVVKHAIYKKKAISINHRSLSGALIQREIVSHTACMTGLLIGLDNSFRFCD